MEFSLEHLPSCEVDVNGFERAYAGQRRVGRGHGAARELDELALGREHGTAGRAHLWGPRVQL